jgi:RNA polymerase sigma factor (sigma-70 family)
MDDPATQIGSLLRPAIDRPASDERLTARAAQGDLGAFAAILRRYQQPLYRYSRAILGNGHDAQEALQNTMVKAMRALPEERRTIHLKPWLYRIAHNESIDLLRAARSALPLDAELAARSGIERLRERLPA